MQFEHAVYHRPSDELGSRGVKRRRIPRSGDVGKIKLLDGSGKLGFWVFDVSSKGGAPVTGPHVDRVRAGISRIIKSRQIKPPHAIINSVSVFLERIKADAAENFRKPRFAKKLGVGSDKLDSLKTYYTNLFATGIAGVVNDNTLTYCNAGHEPLLVVRRGRVIELRDESHSGAIGLFDDTKFGLSKFKLNPGDWLIAHTDGVTDHRKPGRVDCFGSFKLHHLLLKNAHLPPKKLVKALKAALEKHSAFFQDDATLL
ncbi:serine/threonine-protein phosphatase, partial [Candidatus Micrarchaeota archaeon]|nr:serine/threonine-protein phosphatase [Candidatus Micrarchaeota archaeon]